ncbi:unnamed protein product, partial [marine sediment metagenome]
TEGLKIDAQIFLFITTKDVQQIVRTAASQKKERVRMGKRALLWFNGLSSLWTPLLKLSTVVPNMSNGPVSR